MRRGTSEFASTNRRDEIFTGVPLSMTAMSSGLRSRTGLFFFPRTTISRETSLEVDVIVGVSGVAGSGLFCAKPQRANTVTANNKSVNFIARVCCNNKILRSRFFTQVSMKYCGRQDTLLKVTLTLILTI